MNEMEEREEEEDVVAIEMARVDGTKTTSCFIWVKSQGMIYSRLVVIPSPSHPPPSPICPTCLSERSQKLETAVKEWTIFSPGDQRHCGLTLKLKIRTSMYSEMGTVCITTRRREQVCQL